MMKILNRFLETVLAILVALWQSAFLQVITRFLLHNPQQIYGRTVKIHAHMA